MSLEATFRHGEPVMVDYTPSGGNVAAGQVVVLGSVTANTAGTGAIAGIAHTAIVNNTIGALAVGGGVYDALNLNNAALGAKVWWDDTNNKVTTVSTNNAQFGYIVDALTAATNAAVRVRHQPLP